MCTVKMIENMLFAFYLIHLFIDGLTQNQEQLNANETIENGYFVSDPNRMQVINLMREREREVKTKINV